MSTNQQNKEEEVDLGSLFLLIGKGLRNFFNFIGNIFRYRLLRKEKWATLVLHLSFIFILLGAFITRNYGFEGMMSIREGATENTFLSQKTYLTTYIDGDYKIDGQLQRRVLNHDVDFMRGKFTSTEVLAEEFWKILAPEIAKHGCALHKIRLEETINNAVEYFGN